MASEKLILVDFDHTLYRGDSLVEFTRYAVGTRRWFWGIVRLMPILIAYRVQLRDGAFTKATWLRYFFGGCPADKFQAMGKSFALDQIDRHLNTTLYHYLKIQHNSTIVIVTASAAEWIGAWTEREGFQLLATGLKFADGKLKGELEGTNCNGPEKVRRVKKSYELNQYSTIEVYGNGRGDRELLGLAKAVQQHQ
ncbi:HAD family hydrolase [Flavobacterium sp.]|uniref:HAD family hydrolase n=1 Tax=Flavobacterium sp. TaxID=239 RepID=UPI00333F4627